MAEADALSDEEEKYPTAHHHSFSKRPSIITHRSQANSLSKLLEDKSITDKFKDADIHLYAARKSMMVKPPRSDEVSRLISIMMASSSKTNENKESSYIYHDEYEDDDEEDIEKSVISTRGERAAVKLREFQRNALILAQYHDDYVAELTVTIMNLISKLHKANQESALSIDNIKKQTDLQNEGNIKDMAHKREQLDMVFQTVLKTVTRWRRKIDKFETVMRKKRNQFESRLEALIERYDTEMTNRQELLDITEAEDKETKAEVDRLDKLNEDVQKRWEKMIAEIHVQQVDEAMKSRMKKYSKSKKKGKKGKGKRKGSKKGGSKKKGSTKDKGKKGSKGGGGSKKKAGGKAKKGGKKKKSKSSGESGEDESEFGEETGKENETTDGEEEGATSGEEKGSKKPKGKPKSAGKRKDSKAKAKGKKASKRTQSPPTPPNKEQASEEEEGEVDLYHDEDEIEGEFDRPRTDSGQSKPKSVNDNKKKEGKPKKTGKKSGGKKKK